MGTNQHKEEIALLNEEISRQESLMTETKEHMAVILVRSKQEDESKPLKSAAAKQISVISADLEQQLQCSICCDMFSDPLTLECAHTLCEACLDSLPAKSRNCPLCRAPVSQTKCRSTVLSVSL